MSSSVGIGGLTYLRGIAIHSDMERIYWTESSVLVDFPRHGRIGSANLDGTELHEKDILEYEFVFWCLVVRFSELLLELH